MKNRRCLFNVYFALVCLVLTGGCALFSNSDNPKKQQSTIRLYVEGQKADRTTSAPVLVTSNKFVYTIQRDPFLDESDLSQASIIDDPDGSFSIQLRFKDHGSLLLDMYTADNKGKHIIVFSQFPKPNFKEPKAKKKPAADADANADLSETSTSAPPAGTVRWKGWLAAVLIRNRISDGTFRFTPDASREEGIRIVRGLRNVIAKAKKDEK